MDFVALFIINNRGILFLMPLTAPKKKDQKLWSECAVNRCDIDCVGEHQTYHATIWTCIKYEQTISANRMKIEAIKIQVRYFV